VLHALGERVPEAAGDAASALKPVRGKGRQAVRGLRKERKPKKKRGAGRILLSVAMAAPKLLAAGRTANAIRKSARKR
jgi:hypothetical protein